MSNNFKFLTGDMDFKTYGGKFISKKFNNGDWDYWLVLEVLNLKDVMGDEAEKTYHVNISAISPEACGEKNLKSALECCSMDINEKDNILKVLALSDYGVSAQLWAKEGNNIKELLTEAHSQVMPITGLFGFYMDGAKNRIGNTGWDFIAGDLGFK